MVNKWKDGFISNQALFIHVHWHYIDDSQLKTGIIITKLADILS